MIAESVQKLADIEQPSNPFPGLRPFEFHESYLFFGRDGQSEQLIAKLSRTPFLAVVGTSGSGKSSLVRAGLLPALLGGLMATVGSRWRIAIMRPGNDPIGNLADALNAPDAFDAQDQTQAPVQLAITEAVLRRSSLGLVEVVRQANLPPGEQLLVLVDQFEELFRVEQDTNHHETENDKAAFVKLLLAATHQSKLPIYVVLTMRSDYLGDCAQFWDLPEAINDGQYLIPRLTREQRREAITGPVAVGGRVIAPRLVNRLLNDVGDDPDQLPILQHALMRTWDNWQENHQANEPLDLRHYEAIGGLTATLSRHADEAYHELSDAGQKLAEKLFKCLTEKGPDNREIRRPLTVHDLCAVTAAEEHEVIAVIEAFRRSGRSFLMPPAEVDLTADSLIDISHESLIRNWQRLKDWVEEEAQSAVTYKRLADTAVRYGKGEEGPLRDPALQLALNWREKYQPNEAWAQRYHPGFQGTMSFLEQSRKAREAEANEKEAQRRRELQRTRMFVGVLGLAFVIAVVLAWYGYHQRDEAWKRERTNRQLFYVANMKLANKALAEGNLTRGYALLNAFLPATATPTQDDVRGFDWYYLWRLNHKEEATLGGHRGAVNSVAFSPDGKTLASGGNDNMIKLWDVTTCQELATLSDHTGWVTSLAFSPDGKTLASAGSFDRMIKLWDMTTRQGLATLSGYTDVGDVNSVAFSPDGKTLASGGEDAWDRGNNTIKLWDMTTRQELATLSGYTDAVHSVAFSPDGKILASGGGSGNIKLWDMTTRQGLATLSGHIEWVTSVAFSPDGKTLASGSGDKTVKLWDLATRQELATFSGYTDAVHSVAFSPNGKTLASGSGDRDSRTVKLWDVTTRQELATLSGHTDAVGSVAFSPDGKTLASGSRNIKLWDVATRLRLTMLAGHTDTVESVIFSSDGKTLASGSGDKTVKLWDVTTRQELATLSGHADAVHSVVFSSDGKTLASGSGDKTVKLWDVATHQELGTLSGHTNSVTSVAFSLDGKTLASAGSSDKMIKLWDVTTRQELATGRYQRGFVVESMAFSPDGKTLALTIRGEKEVRLRDLITYDWLPQFMGHADVVRSVIFSPDGKTLASGSGDKTVKLWDVATGQELATLDGHADVVRSVIFSPDGKTLASGSEDKTVKLWDVATYQELGTLVGHTGAVLSVTFSPDGKTLASGSEDKTVRLYFAATDEEVERQRSR